MQRQLRKGGGIMDVASGTIGGGNYAGIPMGSRTGFGILKKIGRGIRKIIPNEISKVATVAAPFVAPFNPAVAAAMAGIGSFDQTGNLSDAFKRGALTYGGGQAARFIGGAGFQGNPFVSGGAFTPSGFTAGFSSPLGTETGIGKLLDDRKRQAIGKELAEKGRLNKGVADIGQIADAGGLETGATIVDPSSVSQVVTESAPESVMKAIQNKDYGQAAKLAAEKGFNAIFKTPVRDSAGKIVGYDLDKNVLFAAGAFGLTYADAKKVADQEGVDIGTEAEYDEATKAEKKEEYASYLTNFFGGKKDGGRIGFSEGADLEQKLKDLADYYMERGLSESEAYETAAKELYKAQGGRIGFRFGDKVKDEEGILSMMDKDKKDEDMDDLMAGGGISFSRAEKSFLFRRLGGAGGRDRSYTMPQLYRILSNPNSPSNIGDATILKQIAIAGLGGKKDGGRIGFESGTIPIADSSFKFMELIEDNTNEKEKLINALLDNAREKFPEASEEDIFNFVMSKAAPMSGLMVDGKFVRSKDIETPSIKLSKDMGGPRYDFLMGGEVPVRKNKAGIEELDYRETGGFVPVGVKEKADDVPAMLSKNEFVLTADAVRGIGGGDVEKGAEKLYGVMKQAEKVGRA